MRASLAVGLAVSALVAGAACAGPARRPAKPSVEGTWAHNFVLVLDDTEEPHAALRLLQPYFESAQRGLLVPMMRGRGTIGTRRIWTLVGWSGRWPVLR